MAGHAQEIEQTMQLKFNTSVSTMPKGTRHVTLQYHQVYMQSADYAHLTTVR